MEIRLTRLDATDHGIFGHLVIPDQFNCVTLERHDIGIPKGTYPIKLYTSPVHGLIPLLYNVPGRDMIEIHEGNFEHDSKGCILVGKTRTIIMGEEAISASKDTLTQLLKSLEKSQEPISISIV